MAAAARPYWTGFLKLSLVTIAVRLYTAATERERIRFHMIHEPTAAARDQICRLLRGRFALGGRNFPAMGCVWIYRD